MTWYTYGLIAAVFLGIYNFLYGPLGRHVSIGTVLVNIALGMLLVGVVTNIVTKKSSFAFSLASLELIGVGVILGIAIFLS